MRWVDRGYYSAGDEINAEFSAQTLDTQADQRQGHAEDAEVSAMTKTANPLREAGKWA